MSHGIPDDSAARFALVGCTNFVVSFTAFYLSFHYLPADAVVALARVFGAGDATLHPPAAAVANVLAYLAGMVNSFLLNRQYTFRAGGNAWAQALRFTAVSFLSLVTGTAATFALVDVLRYPPLPVWVPVTVIVMLVNYFGCKHWAFAPPAVEGHAR
jgi:putative flippase GtrA